MKKLLVVLWIALAAGATLGQAPSPEARVSAVLASRGPAAGTYGVAVVDADSGEVLIARDALTPRTPASTMKVVTTGASLMALGLDHRFRTVALAAAKPEPGGNLAGNLVILGGGDPSLDVTRKADGEPGSIDRLARAVARAGVKRIRGDLVLDDSRFDRIFRAPGWPGDQLTRSYCAPVTALTVGRGCLTVVTKPGSAPGQRAKVSTIPAARSIEVVNGVTTTAKKKEHRIILDLPVGSSVLKVSGRVWVKSTGYAAEIAAPDPTLLFGEALRERLVAHGIALLGDVVHLPGAAAKLESPTELAAVETPHLGLLEVTNGESQNLFADCLFKNLGYLATGQGSFAEAGKATGKLARNLGFPDGHLLQVDGSGLSRDNRVTPHFMAKFLSRLYARDDWKQFAASLPYGGQPETTLRRRMKDIGRNVLAKTGTIRGVSGLAGYVRAKTGRVVAFAVLVNDPKTPLSRSREMQDAICRILFEAY
jgi:D-alanyl-D-alanine carboxypeptidase/D-alanyl-D-alanine-endopeptidase (penicillin-binding protein 4)